MGGNSCTFIIRVQLAVIISYSDLLIYGFLWPKHLFDWKKWMERRGQRSEKEREWERKWEKKRVNFIFIVWFDTELSSSFFSLHFFSRPSFCLLSSSLSVSTWVIQFDLLVELKGLNIKELTEKYVLQNQIKKFDCS